MKTRLALLCIGLVACGVVIGAVAANAGLDAMPAPIDTSQFVTVPQAAAAAPVQAVNGSVGQVVVPAQQRQASGPLDASAGLVTWTFPQAFTNPPTCYYSVRVPSTMGYSIDFPVVTSAANDLTDVTVKMTAHPTSLSIASVLILPLSLPVTVNPPTGTTITLTCVGALP